MKKISEISFTPDILKKINSCKTAEELVKLAAENDVELTLSEAEKYFSKGFTKLSDEDLDKIAGGSPGDYTHYLHGPDMK